MSKTVNLQPWLDYFEMLHNYELSGYLQMEPEKHEAYVTHAAIHAMTDGDDPKQQLVSGAFANTVRRLRAYAGYLSKQGASYLQKNFAVHVVKPNEPHDLMYTILLTYRRRWWSLWMKKEKLEVIMY